MPSRLAHLETAQPCGGRGAFSRPCLPACPPPPTLPPRSQPRAQDKSLGEAPGQLEPQTTISNIQAPHLTWAAAAVPSCLGSSPAWHGPPLLLGWLLLSVLLWEGENLPSLSSPLVKQKPPNNRPFTGFLYVNSALPAAVAVLAAVPCCRPHHGDISQPRLAPLGQNHLRSTSGDRPLQTPSWDLTQPALTSHGQHDGSEDHDEGLQRVGVDDGRQPPCKEQGTAL